MDVCNYFIQERIISPCTCCRQLNSQNLPRHHRLHQYCRERRRKGKWFAKDVFCICKLKHLSHNLCFHMHKNTPRNPAAMGGKPNNKIGPRARLGITCLIKMQRLVFVCCDCDLQMLNVYRHSS